MEKKSASQSAAIVAAHRAVESLKPEHERICFDPYAERLLPPSFTVIGESALDRHQALDIFRQHVPGFHEYFIARTRYIDERISEAVKDGTEQLVIVGAGYDTRAVRLKALHEGLVKVFEIDHPATQSVKVKKLSKLLGKIPDYITYIPFDLKQSDLNEELKREGFQPDIRTLFLLEGVSMYLSEQEVEALFGCFSENSAPGSTIIFDFTFPDVIDGSSDHPVAKVWQQKAAVGGEPLTFGIDYQGLKILLSRHRFQETHIADHSYLTKTYFPAQEDTRESSPLLAIVVASR